MYCTLCTAYLYACHGCVCVYCTLCCLSVCVPWLCVCVLHTVYCLSVCVPCVPWLCVCVLHTVYCLSVCVPWLCVCVLHAMVVCVCTAHCTAYLYACHGCVCVYCTLYCLSLCVPWLHVSCHLPVEWAQVDFVCTAHCVLPIFMRAMVACRSLSAVEHLTIHIYYERKTCSTALSCPIYSIVNNKPSVFERHWRKHMVEAIKLILYTSVMMSRIIDIASTIL